MTILECLAKIVRIFRNEQLRRERLYPKRQKALVVHPSTCQECLDKTPDREEHRK